MGLSAKREGQLARLPCAETDSGIDGLFVDGLRRLRGDFFNLHAAGLRSHEDQFAGGAVEHDAEIKLAIDGRRFFNQQPLHLLPLRAGLVRHQLHAQDVLDVQFGVFARLGHLDAAAFAAASGVNLRFHHHAACAFGKQFAGHCCRFFRRVGHFALGHGNAVLRQDFFRLILVNFHLGLIRPVR